MYLLDYIYLFSLYLSIYFFLFIFSYKMHRLNMGCTRAGDAFYAADKQKKGAEKVNKFTSKLQCKLSNFQETARELKGQL